MPSDGMPVPGAPGTGTGDRLLHNTLANILGRFWAIALYLVLTPYIVKRIGLERFGVWSLVAVLTGYVGLLDLGLGMAFVKRLSEYRARREWARLNQTVTTGLATHLAIAVVAGAAALALAGTVARILQVPPPLFAEARMVLGWGLVLFAVENAGSVFPSLVIAYQRMDLTNRVVIGVTIPQVIGTVLVLQAGLGLRGLLLVQAIATCLALSANALLARRLCPSLRIAPRLVSAEAYRDLMGFGMKLQAVKLSDVLTFQTDRLLLARFAGMATVGFYQLGSMVAGKARQMPLLLTSAVFPFASELSAQGKREKLIWLYEQGTRYLITLGLPLAAAVAVLARPLFRAWMGAGYDAAATVVQILAAGYFANMMQRQAVLIGAALDRPGMITRAAGLTAGLNLALSLALVVRFGYLGVAIASTVALAAGPMYYLPRFHRLVDLPMRPFLKQLFAVPSAATVLASGAAALAARGAATLPIGPVRLAGIAEVAAGAAAFGLVYAGTLWRTGFVTAADLRLTSRVVRFGLRAPADVAGARTDGR